MLQRDGCDPDIIAWNGPPFLSQVHVHLRVPQRGLLGYVQDTNRWLTQELRQLRVFSARRFPARNPLSTHLKRRLKRQRSPIAASLREQVGVPAAMPSRPTYRVIRSPRRLPVHGIDLTHLDQGRVERISLRTRPCSAEPSKWSSWPVSATVLPAIDGGLVEADSLAMAVSRIAFSTSFGRFLREIVTNSL